MGKLRNLKTSFKNKLAMEAGENGYSAALKKQTATGRVIYTGFVVDLDVGTETGIKMAGISHFQFVQNKTDGKLPENIEDMETGTIYMSVDELNMLYECLNNLKDLKEEKGGY